MLFCFNMCNDIIILKDKDGNEIFNGESQEEQILLNFTKTATSYELLNRDKDMITLLDKRDKSER